MADRLSPAYGKSNDVSSATYPSLSLGGAAPSALSSLLPAMFILLAISLLTALLFVYTLMPSLWTSIIAVDDSFDRHELSVALVASRMFRIH